MKFNKKLFLFIMVTLLVVFALSGCGIIPKIPDGKISGRMLIPPSEISKDIAGWVAAANAVVTIVDADGVTHTATTDENGYYTFEGIAVNSNTVITAEVELNGDTLILKDIISQAVAADEQYDAGDMDPESTALALVAETLLAAGINPEDIYLEEIESDVNFSDLVERITSVLEERGNITTDPDVIDAVENIINPPAPPTPSTNPAPKLPVYNQTQKKYYNTIQKAINSSGNGDIIVVSAGTYKENIVFDNKNITLKSTDPADSAVVASTIIDGQDLDSVVKFLNDDTSTLEGFTIQNGNEPGYGGGGIFISGSSPVIRYNVIGDNIDDDVDTGNTGDCGGGICAVDDSIDPHIYENIIIGNKGINGGGMYIGWGSPLVENNIIKENVSDNDGGGISVIYSKLDGKSYCPIIRENDIEFNKTSNSYGGGIAVSEEGSAIIENNKINNNETNFDGGGIYIAFNSDADIRRNNTIEENKAGYNGGGIYINSDGIISITANIIKNNMANIDSNSYSGGGIYVDNGSPTIGGNTDTDTNNFNTICGNSPDQVNPDNYPNNDLRYEVNLTVSPGSCGIVTGGGNYCESTEAQIEAIAESGYRFVNWTDDDNAGIEVSTDNPYTFIPDQDVNYTANFFHWTSEIKIYDLGSEQYLDIGDTVVGTSGYDIRYENISAYTIYIILCDQYSCISAAEEIASAGSFSEFRQGIDGTNPNELILIETLAGYDHGWKITWNQKGL
ncbi:MAG: InlB B-repeat-containing protein [Halanaerobiales bacterium]